MIRTRSSSMSLRGSLLSLLLLGLLAGPALAGPEVPPRGETLSSDSVRQRVRDRARMQAEYEEMREERRVRLAAARESVAAALAGEDKSVRNPGVIRALAVDAAGRGGHGAKEEDSERAPGVEEVDSGVRGVMIGALFVLLSVLVYLSLSGKRAGR